VAVGSKASASFLKKRSKKLLFTGGFSPAGATARRTKSFFASFFQKKKRLPFLPIFLITIS
jgi:hypothetical protein